MCGIVGVFGHPSASRLVLAGLRAQQPRGTGGAGLAGWWDGRMHCEKGHGMVDVAFPDMHQERSFPTQTVIGHNHYATGGRDGKDTRNLHPHVVGHVAHCHNGELTNDSQLRARLSAAGVHFSSDNDSELIARMLERSLQHHQLPIQEAVRALMSSITGAYASLALIGEIGVAFRDPNGIRPMRLGRFPNGAWAVASETIALEYMGATLAGQVDPGEMFLFLPGGDPSRHQLIPSAKRASCVFEKVYFSFPTSRSDDGEIVSVHRRAAGARLWYEETDEWRRDSALYPNTIVMPVPDSATHHAIGYARASGCAYDTGIVRRHHKGPSRSFIQPTQEERAATVVAKFACDESVIRGARIVLVDDSLVRGTTMKELIRRLRVQFEAIAVHARIASPPIVAPCPLGINTPTYEELLAYRFKGNTEAMCAFLGADSLRYLSMEGFRSCLSRPDSHCYGCMTGHYPVETYNKVQTPSDNPHKCRRA